MDFIRQWWDLCAFVLFSAMHIVGWIEIRGRLQRAPMNALDERHFAAAALNNASGAGVTAVSILIPASLLIIQFTAENKDVPRIVLEQVFRGSVWFLVSLALGLFIIFVIPMKSQEHNVVRRMLTGIPFFPQFASLLIGMIWLVMGIYTAVYP